MSRAANPENSAGAGEQQALHQKLAYDAEASGAEGQPDCDLPLPCGRARDQQAGDVGARDQQHAAGDGHQHPERRRQAIARKGSALRAR